MSIESILNTINDKTENWLNAKHDEKQKLYLADSLSHAKEFLLSDEYYNADSTINDVNLQLTKFISLSKNYPDTAKEARLYIADNMIIMIDAIRANPLQADIDKVIIAVNKFSEDKIPKEDYKDYKEGFKKLEKLLELIKKLKQRNVNLPDMLLNLFKYPSLSLDKKTQIIHEKIYSLANQSISRDQISGTQNALKVAHNTLSRDDNLNNSNPDYQLGKQKALIEIIEYKGNNFGLLVTMKKEVLGVIIQSSENDKEIQESKGERDAFELFSKTYVPPSRMKNSSKEVTTPVI